MANQDLIDEIFNLRDQGLTDNLIMEELKKRGYNSQQISQALAQAGTGDDNTQPADQDYYQQPVQQQNDDQNNNVYERIEQITESLIEEKWDELVIEVKKIIAWKDKVEEKQNKMENDLNTLKEDFKMLHQGVLGKLEDYDTRMVDVSTELKAVGKVFKDVVPEFVDNVKELKDISQRMSKK